MGLTLPRLLRAVLLWLAFDLLLCRNLGATGPPSKPAPKPASGDWKRDEQGAPISLLEAVGLTLSRSPAIQIQETQTEISRGVILQRSGAFDTHLVGTGSHGQTRQEILTAPTPAPTPAQPIILPVSDLTTGLPVQNFGIIIPQSNTTQAPGPSVFVQNNSSFDVGLRKLLPNGATLGTEAIYSRSNEVNSGPIFNISELRLTLNVPVLRFFTPSDEASLERAAKFDYAASVLAERHIVAQAVFQTTQAYWAVRAAQEQLDLLRKSEETALSLRKLIVLLIQGEERAKAEIHEIDARVSETAARRISGEQAVFEARQQLALAMGLPEEDLLAAPRAGEPFPSVAGVERARSVQDRLISEAVLRRADYQASLKSEQSAKVLLAAARRNLLPPVNFQISASSFGGEVGNRFENLTNSFTGNQTGISLVGQLSFDWPFANRVARGAFIQSSAGYVQAGIRTDDLRRNIVSGIVVSVDALLKGAGQLRDADRAAGSYQDALDTQRLRYFGGEATLLDVINIEDRYTESLLNTVAARQQIASAYARLRFESGTMIPGIGSKITLARESLVSIPELPASVPIARIPQFRTRLQLR